MFQITLTCVLTFIICNARGQKNFIYDSYKYDTIINIFVNDTTEQVMDFYEDSDLWKGYPTRVHVLTNKTLSSDNPVFISATQQKGILSWELPLLVRTDRWALLFNNMGRTLCPHDAGSDIKVENRPTIRVTTSNPKNVSVGIKLRRVTDFYVEVDKKVELNVTPSTPKYYYFSFDQNPWNVTDAYLKRIPSFNYTIPKSIILIIESDDEVCATVSIQNNSCPIFDNEKDIMYQGYYLTMSTKGGITLTQSMFPNGFYVVFVVKESDDECTGATTKGDDFADNASSLLWKGERLKNIRFRIISTISYGDYVLGALVTIALVVLVAVFVLATLACSCKCTETITVIEEEPGPSTSQTFDDNEPSTSEDAPIMPIESADRVDEPVINVQRLTVGQLSQAPPDTLARRSDRYFWGALTVAVVYALPVVQLLFTYQSMVFQTGNQDLCYYNFLCAHPLGFLSDFNHVYSNVGYVTLGLVFMAQVRHRQVKGAKRTQNMGIPQHYGLLYSMGLGLCMEGLLSACYHLCPNKMNFQFDSSFMYVIAVLVMLKLYQNRHSDIIPSAHSTFMLLALIMTIGLFGILYPSVGFSVLFTISHLTTCFILTLKIYYAGKFELERSIFIRAYRGLRTHRLRAFVPTQVARAILLALANIANWTLAIYSACEHNKDFARLLLAILMGNAILYTIFYIVMKIVYREKILPHTWLYIVLTHVAWGTASGFFLDSKTKWSQTPAQSRRHNAPCSSLHFYDSHDLWHVVSSAALFLSFNMLMTIDDALSDTPRDTLPTF
ncbi:hypothetical protein K1T71_000887 [Dendrolimus kikuchii]|uniref:Uncharacterized protein n=1 Tax=Dendrolimus kikuchii TaxID=765133 RepID=A0ACC1DHN3_9NEOP|nr:hypothetical protein K1T71_000887 [Dendrolimus kikuchii]